MTTPAHPQSKYDNTHTPVLINRGTIRTVTQKFDDISDLWQDQADPSLEEDMTFWEEDDNE